jgi:hypothetical protein
MLRREIRPPYTPEEEHDNQQVYDHATRRNVRLVSRHPVRARVRCNQPGSDMRSMCDFDRWIEATASSVIAVTSRILREHFIKAHPSLNHEERETLIGRRVASIRDLPITAPRRALT